MGQGGNSFELKERRVRWDVEGEILYSKEGEALAVLPGEVEVPHPWRGSLPWMGPWAADGGVGAAQGRGWGALRALPTQPSYGSVIFKVPINPNHAMIPLFYDCEGSFQHKPCCDAMIRAVKAVSPSPGPCQPPPFRARCSLLAELRW